jgi:hypothetical protein
LVADQFEASWNAALRELAEATDAYERAHNGEAGPLSAFQRDAVTALASDFPALWANPDTPMRERKRVIRLLVTDGILARTDNTTVHIRLKGRQDRTLSLPIPLVSWEIRQTPAEVVSVIFPILASRRVRTAGAAVDAGCGLRSQDRVRTESKPRRLTLARRAE